MSITGSKPIMRYLHVIRGTNKKPYKIIQECAGDWKTLTDLLFGDSSPSLTRAIEVNHQLPNPSDKCREVFQKWISSHPSDDPDIRGPVTWNVLLAVLEELELDVLAKDIRMYALQQE